MKKVGLNVTSQYEYMSLSVDIWNFYCVSILFLDYGLIG